MRAANGQGPQDPSRSRTHAEHQIAQHEVSGAVAQGVSMNSSKIHKVRGNAEVRKQPDIERGQRSDPGQGRKPKAIGRSRTTRIARSSRLEEGPLANHDQCPVVRHETVAARG